MQLSLESRLKLVRNKIKHQQLHVELKKQKTQAKRDKRKKRAAEIEELGDKVRNWSPSDRQAPPSKPVKTIDNTREVDETLVHSDDEEVRPAVLV